MDRIEAAPKREVTLGEVADLIREIGARPGLTWFALAERDVLAVAWWVGGDQSRVVQVQRYPDWTQVAELTLGGPQVAYLVGTDPGMDLVSLTGASIDWLINEHPANADRTARRTAQDRAGRTDEVQGQSGGGCSESGHSDAGDPSTGPEGREL